MGTPRTARTARMPPPARPDAWTPARGAEISLSVSAGRAAAVRAFDRENGAPRLHPRMSGLLLGTLTFHASKVRSRPRLDADRREQPGHRSYASCLRGRRLSPGESVASARSGRRRPSTWTTSSTTGVAAGGFPLRRTRPPGSAGGPSVNITARSRRCGPRPQVRGIGELVDGVTKENVGAGRFSRGCAQADWRSRKRPVFEAAKGGADPGMPSGPRPALPGARRLPSRSIHRRPPPPPPAPPPPPSFHGSGPSVCGA